MKDLNICEHQNGSYAKTTPSGYLQTAGIEDLGRYAQILKTFNREHFSFVMENAVCKNWGSTTHSKVLVGIKRSGRLVASIL